MGKRVGQSKYSDLLCMSEGGAGVCCVWPGEWTWGGRYKKFVMGCVCTGGRNDGVGGREVHMET